MRTPPSGPRERRRRRLLSALPLLIGIALVAAGGMSQAVERKGRLAGVERWGYQLERPSIDGLAGSPHDLLVVDYSRDGTGGESFTRADVERIRRRPDGSARIVLAYMSIGEAEAYRDYWRWYWGGHWYSRLFGWMLAPKWVGDENREWRRNLAVRYWEPAWQEVILGEGGYLDRILDAGFDGVYLDKVDSSVEKVARGRPSAQDDMRTFVRRIAEKGRAVRPGFLVVPQNGEELLTDPAYVALIDGIAKEDLLYGEFAEGKPNPEPVVARRSALLARAVEAGKTVLAMEYLDDPARIAAARMRLEGLGYVPYFGDRRLRTLRYGDEPTTAWRRRGPATSEDR